MYFERDGRTFLAVKEETYANLWETITEEPMDNLGLKQLTIGGVVIVVDSPSFQAWVGEGK